MGYSVTNLQIPTQVESAPPLASSPVNREMSGQNQPSPVLLAFSPARFNATSKRRAKQVAFTGSLEFMERAHRLGVAERHILRYYAGYTAETRILALRQMESYRRQNNDQPPITKLDSKPNLWKCMICGRSEPFHTFQRIALHVTSTHWQLSSWPCPVKSCRRSYQALDQLRRHKKSHPPEDFNSTGNAPSPVSSPSPRPQTIESQLQQRLPIETPDGITQAESPPGSTYLGTGFGSANLPFEQSLVGIPRSQSQASSVFDLPPPPLPFPVLNELDFLGDFLPELDLANVPSASILTNVFPVNVDNEGQQVRFPGFPRHGQTKATEFPINQGFSQSNTDQDIHWYGYTAFKQNGTSFSSVAHANDLPMSQPYSRMNQGGLDTRWYPDRPTISQPKPGSSSALNNFDRPTT